MNKLFFCITIFIASTLCTQLTPQAIIFDIHGVLLFDDIAHTVKEKVRKELENMHKLPRSLKESPVFKKFCKIMLQYPPMADYPYCQRPPEYAWMPYENYALFSGHIEPDDLYQRTLTSLARAQYDSITDQLLVQHMVHTLFDRKEFARAIKPIPEGVALFTYLVKQLCNNTKHEVYIFSNAPDQWVKNYFDLYPEIFTIIPESHIISSGKIGALKPERRALDAALHAFKIQPEECICIDDTKFNVDGMRNYGLKAIHFDHRNIEQTLIQLCQLGVLSRKNKQAIMAQLPTQRTQQLGERTVF